MVLCRCVGVDLQQPEEAHTGDSLQSGEASEEVSDDQQQLCKDLGHTENVFYCKIGKI